MKMNEMINTRYRSFFLLPIGTHKVLQDSGWLFEAEQRIAPSVVMFLEQALALVKRESYFRIDVYHCEDIKVSVCCDEQGLIEEIYVRLYGERDYAFLCDLLGSPVLESAVLFDPDWTLPRKIDRRASL